MILSLADAKYSIETMYDNFLPSSMIFSTNGARSGGLINANSNFF